MANTKITLNTAGVRALLQSDGVCNMLSSLAIGIAQRAGPGYSYDTYKGKNRWNASVFPETTAAWKDCLNNNTLLKAVR